MAPKASDDLFRSINVNKAEAIQCAIESNNLVFM